MPILVDSASASWHELVVKITVVFLLGEVSSSITDFMKRRASGSIPVEGSSRRTIFGAPSNAIEI